MTTVLMMIIASVFFGGVIFGVTKAYKEMKEQWKEIKFTEDQKSIENTLGTNKLMHMVYHEPVLTRLLETALLVKLGVKEIGLFESRDFVKKTYLLEKDGVKCCIRVESSFVTHELESFRYEGEPVDNFVEPKGLPVANQVHIFAPYDNCDEVCRLDFLEGFEECLEEGKYTFIVKEPERTDDWCYSVHSGSKGLSLQFSKISIRPQSADYLKYSYAPVEVNWRGSAFKVDGALLVEVLATKLSHFKSVGITGTQGTGKTRLMDTVVERLKGMKRIIQVTVDHAFLDGFAGERRNQLINNLDNLSKEYELVLFRMDEGQSKANEAKALANLLSLMEGSDRRDNYVFLVGVNSTQGIDPAVTREGRIDLVVELGKLDKGRANTLAATIAAKSGLKLDRESLDKKIEKGAVTLGEVWACFYDDSESDALDKLLKQKAPPPSK